MVKKFLKSCLLIVLSFISLFMFLVTVAVLKGNSTSTENSTSVETDKTAEKNPAPVETEKTDFKPPENFVLAQAIKDDYKFYLDTSSVKIKTDTATLKEWSQGGLVYVKYDNKTHNVNYNFRWKDSADGVRRIDNIVAAKFDPIFGWLFMKSWECAFGKEYSGKTVDIYLTYPYKDTWVLNWEGVDYVVKANTLDYPFGNVNVINDFSCDVTYNGEFHIKRRSKFKY